MSVHVIQGPDGLNRRAFSADDVRRMTEAGILDENDPFELIDGELIEMAAKGFAHDRTKTFIAGRLYRSLGEGFYVAVEGTLRFDPLVLVEPDILVCPEASVARSDDGYLTVPGQEISLLIEVAVSSMAYYRLRKAALYARFGVPEYWLVDANERRTWVYRGAGGPAYSQTHEAAPTDTIRPQAAALAGVSFRFADMV